MIPDPMEELRAEYRQALPAKLTRLQELWASGNAKELLRALHTLAGSAGTFGLRALGEAAREAETHLAACGEVLDARQRAECALLLETICSKAALAR